VKNLEGPQPGLAAAIAPTPIVELREVTVLFPANRSLIGGDVSRVIRAVDNVSLVIPRGVTFGLVGETGCGKSTVARLILGMTKPTGGTVLVAGENRQVLRGKALRAHSQLVQIVLQDPFSSLDPRMNVGNIIAEPLGVGSPFHRQRFAIQARVRELLEMVGMSAASMGLYPHQFSGGQRQRIAIARALASRPELIVLDEPTSSLDVSVRAQILNLLKELQSQLGVTYVFISHDLGTVSFMASMVAVMYLGRIIEVGPTESVYGSPAHPYTRLLLASVPAETRSFGRLELTRAGEMSADSIPVGCRFHPRCAFRAGLQPNDSRRCESDDPALRELRPDRWSACHYAEDVRT
jgi:peptide/nickel transport system ATP-binding protein